MKKYCRETIGYGLMIILCLGLLPMTGQARVFVETQVVSGTITAVHDNVVELDGNEVFYYPANAGITMNLGPGSVVTLRYYVDRRSNGTRKYIAYAAGKNALKKQQAPSAEKGKNK